MTPDEIRRLVSGYATGTLTGAEQGLLFEAALEDQDLFDELAREQALKELLDEPGAKQRLIAALEEPKRIAWWARPWPWAAAATALTAVVLGVFLTRPPAPRPGAPQEVAAVITPAPPVAQTSPPPVAQESPAPVPREAAREQAAPVSAKQKASPEAAPRSAPKIPPEPKVRNASASEPARSDASAPAPAPSPAASAAQPAQQSTVVPSGAADASGAGGMVQNAFGPGSTNAPRPPVPPPAAGRAMRAMAPAAVRAPGSAEALRAVGRFAFDYAVRADGHLEIRPVANGYLRVTAASSGGDDVIFPANGNGLVRGGSITSVATPDGTTELDILFTARPSEQAVAAPAAKSAPAPQAPGPSTTAEPAAVSGGAAETLSVAPGVAINRAPAAVDAQSGTAEDPSPSANSRVQIRVRVKPRE